MRITHCLMSCDSNPEYLEFWPIAAKGCLRLGIHPVLLYIATDEQRLPESISGASVHTFSPIADIPVIIQAASLRYWGCRYYLRDIVMVNDIDCIVLSKKFFIDRLRDIDDDCYVHVPCVPRPEYGNMRPDIYADEPIDHVYYLNGAYHIARGDIMSRVLDFTDSWEHDCRRWEPYWWRLKRNYERKPWGSQVSLINYPRAGDEIYSSIRVAMCRERERIKLLPYTPKDFHWINRRISKIDKEKLHSGYYSAAHMPRPYSEHKVEIDNFLKLHHSLHPV